MIDKKLNEFPAKYDHELELLFIKKCLQDKEIFDESIISELDLFCADNIEIWKRLKQYRNSNPENELYHLAIKLNESPSTLNLAIHLSSIISFNSEKYSDNSDWKLVQYKIIELSKLRKIQQLCSEAISKVHEGLQDYESISTFIQNKLSNEESSMVEYEILTSEQVLNKTIESIILAKKRRDEGFDGLMGVPTGIKKIDDLTGGFRKKELIIVAARPSVGKTVYGMHIAKSIANTKVPVGIITLEMSPEELQYRSLSEDSGVNLTKIRNANFTDYDLDRIIEAGEKIKKSKLVLCDAPGVGISKLRSIARRMKNKHGIEALIVDYLQLMDGEDPRERRFEAVGKMSRGLKNCAKELNIPVIALAQLNRNAEDREPTMADLRESGNIEQDADCIILMHRNSRDPVTSISNLALCLVKQRNGPVDVIDGIEIYGNTCSVREKSRFTN